MPKLEIDLHIYPDEAALLHGLKQGEQDACTCLVRQFATRLYAIVLKIVADPDEADTVVQTTLMKACSKLDSFEERSQLGTWLYRIATNEALMLRRKLRQEQARQVALTADEPLAIADPAQLAQHDPLAVSLSNELQQQLDRAVAALNPTSREVFLLRDLYGLSVKEAAAQLGVSENVVKVRLHRARQQLREQLAGYLESAPNVDDAA